MLPGNGKVSEREYDRYDIDLDAWEAPKPFGISGCFRLRNESQFMEAAVLSHLPYLDEAVLVVQPSDDDTLERAQGLAGREPKVRVEFYPFVPHWIDTPGHYASPENSVYHLVQLSNWALSRCRYSWICKVEGDVVCLSSFARIREAVERSPEAVAYYGRYILNLAGARRDQISLTFPRNHGLDEAVFNNNPRLWHFRRSSKWEAINVWERQGAVRYMGWSALHLKRCKEKVAGGISGESWAPFDRENVRGALAVYNACVDRYLGPDDPLGEDCLFEKIPYLEAT